ncbi:MAG TPA: hypothetical protein VFQ27_09230 [Xanthobacteraceae bacterium]|nr:hypothetical protein [Xanthobacteraceae bacterium]
MARLRFLTDRDLYEAFPTAAEEMDMEPTDQPSLAFVNALVSEGQLVKAVQFLSYLLPRREAVWWACQSVRLLAPQRSNAEDAALAAAENWVKEPEEERRLQALQCGIEGGRQSPSTWLALAAGWAGGIAMPGVPFPPYQTPRAARAAIMLAFSQAPADQRQDQLRQCIEQGKRLAGDEP